MYSIHIIETTLKQLKEQNFRNGFSTSVASEIQTALYEHDSVHAGNKFWSEWCNVSKRNPKPELIDKVGLDVYELFLEVDELASGPGSFQMPSWGTKGT